MATHIHVLTIIPPPPSLFMPTLYYTTSLKWREGVYYILLVSTYAIEATGDVLEYLISLDLRPLVQCKVNNIQCIAIHKMSTLLVRKLVPSAVGRTEAEQ